MRWQTGTWRLGLVGALLLAACGQQGTSPSAPDGSDGGSSQRASEAPAEPQTLTIWTWKENHVPALEAAGEAFAATSDTPVTVEVEFYPETDGVYQNAIMSSARTGELPDLLSYYGGSHWELGGSGILTDITSDIDEAWLSVFPDALVEGGIQLPETLAQACDENPDCAYPDIPAGAIYGLPQISGATGYVFANKEKLEAAGVDTSAPPASWSDWVSAMEATVADDPQTGGLALGLKVPETGYLWVYRLISWSHLGRDAFEARFEQGGDWTDPESIETFELHDQLSPVWLPNALQTDIGEAESAFGRGDAAWLIGGTFSYSTLSQAGISPDNVMVFPIPTADGDVIAERELKPWVSVMLGITKDTENRDLALAFMRHLFSVEGAAAFAEEAQDLPAVAVPADSVESEALVATQDAFSDSPDAFDEFAVYGPQCEAAATVNNEASVALTRLITGEATPEEVAQEFQRIFDTGWSACSG